MEKKFKILFAALIINENRPPLSYKVREYFEDFVLAHIIDKFKIFKGKWNIQLVFFLESDNKNFKEKEIALPQGSGYTTISSELVKMYDLIVNINGIEKSEDIYLETIKLIYECLTVFFCNRFKSIKPEQMQELWNKVDLNYLLSLPYPAKISEQKYVGDDLIDLGFEIKRN